MSIYEQIAQAARNKPGYVDTAGMAQTVNTPKQGFNPRPRTFNVPTPVGGSGAGVSGTGSFTDFLKNLPDRETGGGDQSDPGLFDRLGGAVGSVFGGVLSGVDAARRGYQGLAGEVGDFVAGIDGPMAVPANIVQGAVNPFRLRGLKDEETGQRDTSFDAGEIWDRVTGEGQIAQGFLGHTDWDDSLPGPLRTALGFAGDVATDPLTYATFGVGGVIKGGASSAARTTLAQSVVQGAKTSLGREVAPEVVDRLAREVGTRGLGGLTERGLARAGATIDDAVKLGVKPEFGMRVGVGKTQLRVPGTATVAQSMDNIKGSIKAFTGGSRGGRLTRELFTTADHGERALTQAVLSGAPNAAEAARGLVRLGEAKGDAWQWMDQTANQWKQLEADGVTLGKLSDEQARAVTVALDSGDFSDPLVREVADFFENAGRSVRDKGVEFSMRSGYVPHRLSETAVKMFNAGDEDIRRLMDDSIDAPEAFQKLRQTDDPIDVINARWRETHDYDLLETDVRVLGAQWMGEARNAVMKARLTADTGDGLVRPKAKVVDGDKAMDAVEAAEREQAGLLSRSVANRRQGINKGLKAAKAQVDRVRAESRTAQAGLVKAERAAVRAKDRMVKAEGDATAARSALELAEQSAKTLRGKEKAQASRRANDMRKVLDDAADSLQRSQRHLAKADKDINQWKAGVRLLSEELDTHEATFSRLMDERAALDAAPFAKDAVKAQADADRLAARAAVSQERFAKAQSDVAAAESTVQWLGSDAGRVSDRLQAEMAELDDLSARVQKSKKSGKPTEVSNNELRVQQRQIMSGLRDLLRESDDPLVVEMAKLEAQAVVADAAHFRAVYGDPKTGVAGSARKMRQDFESGVNLLNDPRFQEYVVEQTEAGMVELKRKFGDDLQVDAWYKETIEQRSKFVDPSTRGPAFRALKSNMDRYSKAMNWWKGWALASPGFVVRNLYSGMFGMFLDDALSPTLGTRFSRYLRQVQKDPEGAAVWAAKRYGTEGARRLDDAYRVAAASGWGVNAQEVSTSLLQGVSKNPLSGNQPFPFYIRQASSEAEAFLRGGHALAVLERGGSYQDALQRVQKFHFNYRDISEFDRAAKQAMPFWTFFSRNIGLQMSVYSKQPQKVNRSFVNFKRNVEEQAGADEGAVPDYFTGDLAGILTPFGSAEGRGRMYLTPDIPSARFPSQMQQLVSDPLSEIGSSLGPAFKIPIELASNRELFTGREYRNQLTSYDSTGEVPREAPWWGQIPGVTQGLDLLPGTERIGGRLLMQDNTEAALNNLNPTLSRLSRAVPGTERQEETFRQYWLNFLGAGLRWNDPGSQAGAMAGREREAQAAAAKVQERIRLERLVSENRGD